MGILKTKVTKEKLDPMDLLLENFAGEQVEVVVDRDFETPMIGEEGELQIVNIPLTITGYLTDHDDKFIYLGLSVNQINQCIQKDYIVHIGIVDEAMIAVDDQGKIPKGKFN